MAASLRTWWRRLTTAARVLPPGLSRRGTRGAKSGRQGRTVGFAAGPPARPCITDARTPARSDATKLMRPNQRPRLLFCANLLRFRATCAARPRSTDSCPHETVGSSARIGLAIAALALFRQAASLLVCRPFAARGVVHGGRGVAHGGPSALTDGGSSRGSRWPQRARQARRSPALRPPTAPAPTTV